MRPNSYTRRDMMATLWRVFGPECKAVRAKLVPGSEFITVVFELSEPLDGDEVFHLVQKEQHIYEESRHPYRGPKNVSRDVTENP